MSPFLLVAAGLVGALGVHCVLCWLGVWLLGKATYGLYDRADVAFAPLWVPRALWRAVWFWLNGGYD